MTYYRITSVHHKDLGSIGDVIELSEEEFAELAYNSKLQKADKPKSTKEKSE